MKLYKITPQYLAGLADSDGSFSISCTHKQRRYPHHRGSFQITWIYNKLTLHIFKSIKAKYGGNICITKNKTGFNNKPTDVVKYMTTNKLLYALINDILPHLLLKKKQAQLILKLSKTYRRTPGYITKKTFDYRESLYQRNRQLNSKNGKNVPKHNKFIKNSI